MPKEIPHLAADAAEQEPEVPKSHFDQVLNSLKVSRKVTHRSEEEKTEMKPSPKATTKNKIYQERTEAAKWLEGSCQPCDKEGHHSQTYEQNKKEMIEKQV